jgi:hypothetical protein
MRAFIHETANVPTYPVKYDPEGLLAISSQNQLLYIRRRNFIFIAQKPPWLRGIFFLAPQFHFALLSYLADAESNRSLATCPHRPNCQSKRRKRPKNSY